MSNDVTNKPSLSVDTLLPLLDTDNFQTFLQAYYEWMESTRITYVNASGTFVVGDVITGQTSNSKGQIKHVGDGFIVLKMSTKTSFDIAELIQNASSVTATVSKSEDNVLRKADRIIENKSFDESSGQYFEYIKSELNRGIPTVTEADRRVIGKKIKDFYSAKSTEDAYRYFFKAVFNDDVIFRFPGDEILRVSDGRFEKTSVLRANTTYDAGEGDGPQPVSVFTFLNKTVRGRTSNAVANIIDIRITYLGGVEFAEFTLSLVSGEFTADEEVFAVDDSTLVTTIYGLVSGFNITNGGSGYSIGDSVNISGNGFEASASVSSINSGAIGSITIDSVGHGYQLGTRASVDNTNTGGTGLVVEVTGIKNTYDIGGYTVGEISEITILNRGDDYFAAPILSLTDTVISSIGALTDKLITIVDAGDNYAVGDALVFSGAGSAAGIVASVAPSVDTNEFAFEDGFNLTLEGENGILINDDPTVDGLGPISRIELTDFGTGYTNSTLPTITVTSGTGSLAELKPTGIQGTSAEVSVDSSSGLGLGSIREIEIDNFGVAYEQPVTATVSGSGTGAQLEVLVSGIGIGSGQFLTTDGLVGRRIIQDSLFFQDFSYVIRSGLGFNTYRSIIKDVLHPAGTEFFGEILISSLITVAANFTSVITQPRPSSTVVVLEEILAFTPTASSAIKLIKYFSSAFTDPAPIVSTNSYNVEIALQTDTPISTDVRFAMESEISSVIYTAPETSIEIKRNIVKTSKTEVPASLTGSYEIEVASSGANVSPSISLFIEFPTYTASEIQIFSSIYTAPETQIIFTRQLKQELDLSVSIVEPLGLGTGELFGNLAISVLAADQISTYKNKKFSDPYDIQRPLYRQIRIDGTVSTSGTTITGVGTSFDTEFSTGEYIIIDTEKFIITNINSASEMVVNVAPTQTYTSVQALREYLL